MGSKKLDFQIHYSSAHETLQSSLYHTPHHALPQAVTLKIVERKYSIKDHFNSYGS